jgi:hypothetical protein
MLYFRSGALIYFLNLVLEDDIGEAHRPDVVFILSNQLDPWLESDLRTFFDLNQNQIPVS